MMVAGAFAALVGLAFVSWVASNRRDQRVLRAPITTASIVMLGDSITEEGPWETAFADLPIANRGYSGYTTAQLVDVAREVAAEQPRAVYVLTGTNDIRDGHPPSWTIRHLAEILDEFAASAPRTDVVLQTILPRADRNADVDIANVAIVGLAEQRGLAVLDLHAVFDNGRGALRAEETRDGLHLNDAGNERWSDVLIEEFRSS